MNIYQKFIKLALEAGLSEVEISVNKSSSFNVDIYHHEIENYGVSTDITTTIRGVYNDKFGTATCTTLNKDNTLKLIRDLIANAKSIEKDEVASLFEGSLKYHKISTYNKTYESVSSQKKIDDMFLLEKTIESQSQLIKDVVGVSFSDTTNEYLIINSHGLNLKQKSNYFYISGGVVVKKDEDEQTNFEVIIDNNYNNFNIENFAKKIVDNAIRKLNASPCDSKKMKTILDKNCVSTLLSTYLDWANAESVQKHTSLFEGKLNTKIASSKLNIADMPQKRTIYARWFDDEGVATYNKDIIKNGVLKTYLYNRETAKKDNVESTGNGINLNSKIAAGSFFTYVKPGKKSLDELFQIIKDGIYITNLEGAHAGINSVSGDFSLQAEGFLIENGKLSRPVSLITLSGNILKLFADVKMLANDSEILPGGISTPSIYIKSLSISGR